MPFSNIIDNKDIVDEYRTIMTNRSVQEKRKMKYRSAGGNSLNVQKVSRMT